MLEKHTGGCHCGKVRFEVQVDVSGQAIECNCSHCQGKGLILMFVSASQFTLQSGEGDMQEYLFNKKLIRHMFCTTCGVEAFAYGKDKEGNDTVALNLRWIDGIDLTTLNKMPFNGKDY